MTTTETPLPLDYRIPSGKHSVLLRNLRPGDWLRGPTGIMFCVYRHAKKQQSFILWRDTDHTQAEFAYAELLSLNYVGRGKPRFWLALLPDWLIGNACLYSQP